MGDSKRGREQGSAPGVLKPEDAEEEAVSFLRRSELSLTLRAIRGREGGSCSREGGRLGASCGESEAVSATPLSSSACSPSRSVYVSWYLSFESSERRGGEKPTVRANIAKSGLEARRSIEGQLRAPGLPPFAYFVQEKQWGTNEQNEKQPLPRNPMIHSPRSRAWPAVLRVYPAVPPPFRLQREA